VNEEQRLLTAGEVSEYLQVSVRTLAHWRRSGEGPRAYRIGNRIRYRAVDVNRYVAEHAIREPAWKAA